MWRSLYFHAGTAVMATRAGSRNVKSPGTRAGGRGARSVATRAQIPTDLADRWDLLVKTASENLYQLHQNIGKAIGKRPYQGLPISEKERTSRWAQIVSDPQAIAELLHSNAKYTVDGRVLVPNELLDEMVAQHARRTRGGYE